ncbi:hypothetical protein [Joostella sp. CR20]|uniref:hypothetical protein n=1 Tax=Joostella sp. CR20 TaxID=2804312 RepID=UPI00313C2C5B
MKVIKYIASVLLIISALGGISKGDFLTGLLFLILGIIILPPVSDILKEKFKLWQNKAVRYITYITFILIAGATIDKPEMNDSSSSQEEPRVVDKNTKNKVRYINLDKTYYDENMKKVEPDDNDVIYRVVEELKHDKNKGRVKGGDNEVIALLVEVDSYDEQDLKKIIKDLKKEYAQFTPDNCFLDLWDDKKAYETYLAREDYIKKSFNKLMDEYQKTAVPIGDKHSKLKRKWDEKNYPFIADHNIASSDFTGLYSYFPLQDDYYKEIGGEKYKK